MKYVKILEQRGLKKEDLAKQTQKKIEQLEDLKKQLDEFDKDDFDDEDKEKYDFIQNSILELDIELERNIRKFDVDIYKKRLEVFESNKKNGKPVAVKKEAPVVSIEQVEEIEEAPVLSTTIKASNSHIVSISEPINKPVEPKEPEDAKKVNSIKDKLANLKKELNVNTEKFDRQEDKEPIEVEAEEVEEYHKQANVKPKKGSLAVILMTIGFGILTFGSVLYYKERK